MRKIKLKNIKKFETKLNNPEKVKNKKGAPLFRAHIRAGFQNVMEDDIEKRISLDKEFEIESPSTFVFTVSGDSMVDFGIYEGDLAVVKRTSDINDRDVVVANIDGFYTIKICRKSGNNIWLEAANPSYKSVKPKFKLEIFGKVIGITRKI